MHIHDMDAYTFCDSPSGLRDALETLNSATCIILDCEGKVLGKEGGSLSIISLRTVAPSPQTFLIDAILLNDSTLRPLFDLLESPKPTKIVFDGRMDFSELYHSRQITLTAVQDLQLVDIKSRRMRGETENDQLRRLSPYLNRQDVLRERQGYLQVQKISGLSGCLNEHGVKVSKDKSFSHELWLRRPLPRQYLRYAARDVYAISRLFERFMKAKYIDQDSDFFDESQRYITMWQDKRPRLGDIAKNHALLPLGILDVSTYHQHLKPCMSCHRRLSSDCFTKKGWGIRKCWVCRALDAKA